MRMKTIIIVAIVLSITTWGFCAMPWPPTDNPGSYKIATSQDIEDLRKRVSLLEILVSSSLTSMLFALISIIILSF